ITARRTRKDAPHITLVFVVNTMNIEDLPNFIELASFLGVDSVQCNYLTVFKEAHLKLSCFFMQQVTNEMFDKAGRLAEELNIDLKLPPKFSQAGYFKTRCPGPWKDIYVDTEGAVLPCCSSGEHYGELRNSDVLSIWNNQKYQQIRADLASGNAVNMCKYCLNSNPANVNLLNSHVSFRPDVQKVVLN
ncbi:MAG: SPASM domain-containing protein, partial [Candidatus Omnitrophota bacterium]